MQPDLSAISIAATKPDKKIALGLKEMGITVLPVVEDEGDVDRYILSKRLAVERRNGSGFLKGIMEKTLFTSAIYLREHFQVPVLIVEGRINYQYSMMDPQATRGALSSMLLLYGINVLSTADAEETVALIAMMARQEQIGIPDISLIPKRKATSLPDLQRRVVEMLPGAGMVMARELLQHFGSIERITRASPEELKELRGLGAKKVKQMHEVMHAEYEAVDVERQIEDAVERDHSLLFDRPVTLLARQHHIFTEDKHKHIIDMVFFDKKANELILVELKRGVLGKPHYEQLCRYLDNAQQSGMLRGYLQDGASMTGILATVEECACQGKRREITSRIIDKKKVIAWLLKARKKRMK